VNVALTDGRVTITCLDAGNNAFAEPFFYQTIEAASLASPVVTGHEELRAALDRSFEPAGLIFHVSRCGSTLLSQLLKEISGVRVYAEPTPVSEALLLAPYLEYGELRDLVDTVVRAFCAPSKRVFFKFSSWNVLHYSLFEELFPAVPKVFLVRRPVEVLASIAKTPPGYVLGREPFAETVRRRAGDRTDALDDVEFGAVVLSLFLDAMAGAVHANGSIRVLDYTDLPSAAWRTLPAFFGIPKDGIDVQRLVALARFHAKSYPFPVPFQKEDASMVVHADPATLKRPLETWIGSRYDALIALRDGQLASPAYATQLLRNVSLSAEPICPGEGLQLPVFPAIPE
jgi:hypothetical protein